MKNIDPEKSNSNQPPQIYICLVVSLSPQWLLICSKKKKIKWPTTTNPAMADHSKPQTQPWPTTPKPNPAIHGRPHHNKPSHGRPLQSQTQPWPTTPNPPRSGFSLALLAFFSPTTKPWPKQSFMALHKKSSKIWDPRFSKRLDCSGVSETSLKN